MTYDPEAVVAEFDEKLTKSVDEGGFGDQYTSDGPLHFKVGNLKDWLRAALLAAHRAGREEGSLTGKSLMAIAIAFDTGKREAWRKALGVVNLYGRDEVQGAGFVLSGVYNSLRDAARADGVDLA